MLSDSMISKHKASSTVLMLKVAFTAYSKRRLMTILFSRSKMIKLRKLNTQNKKFDLTRQSSELEARTLNQSELHPESFEKR